jgi:hypothetical protein
LPWYIAWVRKEKATMRGAPFSFVSCVIICTVLLGIGLFWLEERHYAGIIAEKDATIVQKDETARTISEERDKSNRENERLRNDNALLQSIHDEKNFST